MNTVINPKSVDGRYWLSCIQERRTKKTTTFSIKQLEHIIISSIQPFLYNFDYNQEYREFIFDVHTVLTDLLEEAKLEQKKLNDSYTKQTTSIVFI
ncbi:hypothetical protein [Pedobacter sp. WC2423]|uniref:hypothetical protein n=1 Tax=Pedobacter sp. WC2423 TaxID=3234142 RepID=UPI003467CA12